MYSEMDININDFGQPSSGSQQPTYSHSAPLIGAGAQVEYSRPMAPSFTSPSEGNGQLEGSLHRSRYSSMQSGYNYTQSIYPPVIYSFLLSSTDQAALYLITA